MTMKTLIDEELYRSEVETQAEYLATAAVAKLDDADQDEIDSEILDQTSDSLDGHYWFSGSETPLFHSGIIHYSEADPEQTTDLDQYITGKSPGEIISTLAYLCFRADVVEEAQAIAPSMAVGFVHPHVSADVTELDDETLIDQLEALAVLEENSTMTDFVERYLWDIREEMLKRASTGGPHAEYTGPE